MKLLVEIKSVYGNELIYPMCDRSRMFAELVGRKTLSPRQVEVIKQMGFEIEVKGRTI
jgi:hypothetical protein